MTDDSYQSFLANKKGAGPKGYCANVSLFRFLGHIGITLDGATVLEVGFGGNYGADLIEAAKRGATPFGIDMVASLTDAVAAFDIIPKTNLATAKAGADPMPFKGPFDLIYARDTIYYMTEPERAQFFADANAALSPTGTLVTQFIEGDFQIPDTTNAEDFTPDLFTNATPTQLFEAGNPVKFLKPSSLKAEAKAQGLTAIAAKRLIQSHGKSPTQYRVDHYLAFQAA